MPSDDAGLEPGTAHCPNCDQDVTPKTVPYYDGEIDVCPDCEWEVQ